MANLVIFRDRLRATSMCFDYNFFRIELSCEWVDAKILNYFHRMFLHFSVAMEMHFAKCHILKIAITMHSNLTLFDSQ